MQPTDALRAGAPETTSRFARQFALEEIGPAGQERLSRATVAIAGCGALGCAQADLLARAGIGRLILIDRDVVQPTDLHRQCLYDERDARESWPKPLAAARRLKAIDPAVATDPVTADLVAANAEAILRPADLVLDGTDNFPTRYLLNDLAVRTGRPWIYGGVLGTLGTVMAVRPGRGPCLRCIAPELPDDADLPTCRSHGVLNAAVAWVAALQVSATLRILLDAPDPEPRLHELDVWSGIIRSIRVLRDPACPCCGLLRFDFLDASSGMTATVLCGRNAVQLAPIDPTPPDVAVLHERLVAHGTVAIRGALLEFTSGDDRMVFFPDGRVLVLGTTEIAAARRALARYLEPGGTGPVHVTSAAGRGNRT
jgi:adenylyltransferase/sulfurtransferase